MIDDRREEISRGKRRIGSEEKKRRRPKKPYFITEEKRTNSEYCVIVICNTTFIYSPIYYLENISLRTLMFGEKSSGVSLFSKITQSLKLTIFSKTLLQRVYTIKFYPHSKSLCLLKKKSNQY